MAPPTKKRRIDGKIKVTVPEKIDFDFSAREEYLTGFHKRKVARQKYAQEEIAKREKEEKLRFRRELRQQRKIDLEKHVEEVNRLVKQANGDIPGLGEDESSEEDEEEFTGFEEPEPINQEDEYIDEDKYTTVTIESVGIDRLGFLKPGDEFVPGNHNATAADGGGGGDGEGNEDLIKDATKGGHEVKRDANGKRIWTKERPRTEWPKKKKKKFRYESKADRKATRVKEGMKKKKLKEKRAKNAEA